METEGSNPEGKYWPLVGGLLVLPVAWVMGGPFAVRLLTPLVALAAGLYARWHSPVLLVRLVLWTWALTPLLRRLVDYRIGYESVNLVMLAPYLVTAPAFLDLAWFGKALAHKKYVPFLAILLGITWGYGVGVLRMGFLGPTFKLLEWVVPPFFGMYLYMRAGHHRAIRDCLESTLRWIGVLVGAYGIYQFLALPPWDAYWMKSVGSFVPAAIQPMGFRAFGTLNSRNPFGVTMMVSAVCFLGGGGSRRVAASVPALLALLLSGTRAAWGGWVIAVAVTWQMAGSTGRRSIVRYLAIMVLAVLVMLPSTAIGPVIFARLGTLMSLTEDYSYRERTGMYARRAVEVLVQPIGQGIGSIGTAAKLSSGSVKSVDSGYYTMLLELGWVGTIPYVWGFAVLFGRIGFVRRQKDISKARALGIIMGFLAMMVLANTLVAVRGILLWSFVGTALAAASSEEATRQDQEMHAGCS
jgi:hypothetical protein